MYGHQDLGLAVREEQWERAKSNLLKYIPMLFPSVIFKTLLDISGQPIQPSGCNMIRCKLPHNWGQSHGHHICNT